MALGGGLTNNYEEEAKNKEEKEDTSFECRVSKN